MAGRTKRDPKLLKALDVSRTLGRSIGSPTVESTAISLSAYFRGGGRAIPYDMAEELAIAVLFEQRTFDEARSSVAEVAGERHQATCLQVFDAIIAKYKGRVSNFALIPSRLVGIGPGIGIRMPSALLTKVDGQRRFIIFQPRRGRGVRGDRAGFFLSMFNEKHSVNEEFGVNAELLDMQCFSGSKERDLKIIRSEDVWSYSKEQIDRSLATYTAAMKRLIENPKRYGVSEAVAQDWRPQMDEEW